MHDEHFLTRLDRLEDRQVSDALALYYDAELVRSLLTYAQQRGHGDRVAISIDDPVEGPFIVVTQRGDFVTTLARGMIPGDLPIIPRAVWDALRRSNARTQAAWDQAASISRGKLSAVAREFVLGGPRVSREVMELMIGLSRILEDDFIDAWLQQQTQLSRMLLRVQSRETYLRCDEAFFRQLEQLAWASAHTMVLLACGNLKKRPLDDPLMQALSAARPSALHMVLGEIGFVSRALWMVGKMGPLYFASLKEDFRAAQERVDALDAGLGLAAIGQRFSKYRGEARKTLLIAERPDETHAQETRRLVGGLAAASLSPEEITPPGGLRAALREMGARLWLKKTRRLPESHPLRFERAEDVPEEIALALMPNMSGNIWDLLDAPEFLVLYLPATFGLQAEELYYPRAALDAFESPEPGVRARDGFERMRAHYKRYDRPVRAPERPGRNDPCTCGSGKKYKRCCGA